MIMTSSESKRMNPRTFGDVECMRADGPLAILLALI